MTVSLASPVLRSSTMFAPALNVHIIKGSGLRSSIGGPRVLHAQPEQGRLLLAATRSGEESWLLRPEEVAELFNISRSKVYQLMADGSLPSVTIGRSRRIRREDAQRFLIDRASAQR